MPVTELTVLIFSERCCFVNGATALHEYTVPKQVHRRGDYRSVGSRVLAWCPWPTTTPSCIRDEQIDPTPSPRRRNHRRYRLVAGLVDLDTQSGAVRCLNLDHLEAFERR